MGQKVVSIASSGWIIEQVPLPKALALVCVIERRVETIEEKETYYSALFSKNKNLFLEENSSGCGIYHLTEKAVHHI